jgi:hypothetical protein
VQTFNINNLGFPDHLNETPAVVKLDSYGFTVEEWGTGLVTIAKLITSTKIEYSNCTYRDKHLGYVSSLNITNLDGTKLFMEPFFDTKYLYNPTFFVTDSPAKVTQQFDTLMVLVFILGLIINRINKIKVNILESLSILVYAAFPQMASQILILQWLILSDSLNLRRLMLRDHISISWLRVQIEVLKGKSCIRSYLECCKQFGYNITESHIGIGFEKYDRETFINKLLELADQSDISISLKWSCINFYLKNRFLPSFYYSDKGLKFPIIVFKMTGVLEKYDLSYIFSRQGYVKDFCRFTEVFDMIDTKPGLITGLNLAERRLHKYLRYNLKGDLSPSVLMINPVPLTGNIRYIKSNKRVEYEYTTSNNQNVYAVIEKEMYLRKASDVMVESRFFNVKYKHIVVRKLSESNITKVNLKVLGKLYKIASVWNIMGKDFNFKLMMREIDRIIEATHFRPGICNYWCQLIRNKKKIKIVNDKRKILSRSHPNHPIFVIKTKAVRIKVLDTWGKMLKDFRAKKPEKIQVKKEVIKVKEPEEVQVRCDILWHKFSILKAKKRKNMIVQAQSSLDYYIGYTSCKKEVFEFLNGRKVKDTHIEYMKEFKRLYDIEFSG